MSIWFMDGFDHYSDNPYAVPVGGQTTADFLKKWTTASNNMSIGPGYARQQPGQGMKMQNMNVSKTRPGTNVDTYIIGYAFQLSIVSTASAGLIIFEDTGSEQCSVRTDATGHILFSRNGTTLATSTNVLSAGVWYYLEAKAKIHPSAGTYEVRINGISAGWIPPATGANTRTTANSILTDFRISVTNSFIQYTDDLYAADTNGSSNNDFLGPQVITVLRPAGAGNYTQWTSNGFTNFGNVNEITPDGDVSFNQDTVQGHKDSFTMSDTIFNTGNITGIQHVLFARQDSGLQRTIRPFQRSGGVDYAGTAVNTSSSYSYILDPKDVDPATNSAYSITNLNAAEFGYELVS